MKGKIAKIVLLVLFLSILLFPATFRSVRVPQGSVGCVYNTSSGATLGWIPADGQEHSILRFRGYREMHKGLHADSIVVKGKTFKVWNEPVHNDAEIELYAKYGWDYFAKLTKPLTDQNNNLSSDVTAKPLQALQGFLAENGEVKRYLRIKSVSAN